MGQNIHKDPRNPDKRPKSKPTGKRNRALSKNGSKNISEVRYNVKNFNIGDFDKKVKDNSV
jgi:hypothetical protein